jgi:hypothetical protein
MSQSNLEVFSQNRLGGELIPVDVQILLAHVDEFLARTGMELNSAPDWAPCLDTSYLSETDLADPAIAANVKLMDDVCA